MSKSQALTREQTKHLLYRIAAVRHPDVSLPPDPPDVVRARKVIKLHDAKNARIRIAAGTQFVRAREKARDAVYFGKSVAEILRVVHAFEKLGGRK